ncbi:MAG: hypothetical protein NTV51_01620 [Verrucomicrobia bacterium]|nr:hypothetical protein [Verrucomicrobiota bacterium]
MKSIRALLLGISLAATAWSQAIPLTDLVGPNNLVRDPVYGISVTYPAGWELQGAQRWGKNDKENTLFFRPIWPLESRPSLYYQPRSNFDSPAPGQEEAHFRYTAGTKAASRVKGGMSDYKNLENTFTFTQINGRPAFRYVALFTRDGRQYFEYFTRILGQQMMVMFFTMGPIEELETIRRDIDQMSATVQVP